ncbi:MAG: tetratricopeptide repeat protein [Thermodesulfobacteriota bacterium]
MKKLIILLFLPLLIVSCYSRGNKSSAGDYSSPPPHKLDKETELSNQKQLAIASVRRGNFQQAIKDIAPAEEIDDKDPEVYLIKGVIYYGLKDNKTAEENYLYSLKLDSDYTEAHYNLCGLYLVEDKLDQAITECSFAASDPLYRARASALTNLGIAYFRKGDVNKAKQYYDKALEINPAYVYTHNEIGKLFMSIGKEEDAILEFKQAISGFPEYDEAHYNLGVVYLKQQNNLLACHQFNKVVELTPNSQLGLNSKKYLNTVCYNQYTN